MPKVQYFVRPEYGAEDRIGPVLGPFDEFLQLTYTDLRVGPNGEPIAGINNGCWGFSSTYRPNNVETPIPVHTEAEQKFDKPWYDLLWSDVVIWGNIVE